MCEGVDGVDGLGKESGSSRSRWGGGRYRDWGLLGVGVRGYGNLEEGRAGAEIFTIEDTTCIADLLKESAGFSFSVSICETHRLHNCVVHRLDVSTWVRSREIDLPHRQSS